MRSAKLIAPRIFEVQSVQPRTLDDDEVLLDVISCGICSSEAPVFLGDVVGTPGVSFRYKSYPSDLGHEVVGKVTARGARASRFEIGEIVTGLTYSGCGFSEFFIEKEAMLVRHPIQDEIACKKYVGEPLMATINIINQIKPNFADRVAIIGDGFMSLLLVAALAKYPFEMLIVAGHHDNRLQLAREFGATDTINSKNSDPWQFIMDKTAGDGVDISVEYAGVEKSLQLAASICKPKQQAKLVLASAYNNDMPFTIGNYLQNRAPVLIPAYPNHSLNKQIDLERAMTAIEMGVFPMEKLVTHEFPLDDVTFAHEAALSRSNDYIKGIVIP